MIFINNEFKISHQFHYFTVLLHFLFLYHKYINFIFRFYMFSKPVDINEVPDYLNIINEPMDLETMMTKIDLHKYTCAQDFLNDIDLLCRNALEYNPDKYVIMDT